MKATQKLKGNSIITLKPGVCCRYQDIPFLEISPNAPKFIQYHSNYVKFSSEEEAIKRLKELTKLFGDDFVHVNQNMCIRKDTITQTSIHEKYNTVCCFGKAIGYTAEVRSKYNVIRLEFKTEEKAEEWLNRFKIRWLGFNANN